MKCNIINIHEIRVTDVIILWLGLQLSYTSAFTSGNLINCFTIIKYIILENSNYVNAC